MSIVLPPIDPERMIKPRRRIQGISAILLPFLTSGEVDWPGFRAHALRTSQAGLTPAVNMDTGYVNLIDDGTRIRVLEETRAVLAGRPFVAGVFVADSPGDPWNPDAYLRAIERVQSRGGVPVLFQSHGLTSQSDEEIIRSYELLGRHCDQYIAFELGRMFAPFGSIYSLEVYAGLMGVQSCIGAKHSSLDRRQEWARLLLRDQTRPEFQVYTGNDLAIDMVIYGSDYLLGLSTFAPDAFALRDRYWAEGDPRFHELNDVLQYLGFLAFRAPVPGYKHSAAMMLKLRGWIDHDATHPGSPSRPDSDRELLKQIAERLLGLLSNA